MPQRYVTISITPEKRYFAIRGLERLTAREKEILQGIVDNKTCKEIGRSLGISTRTAEVHRHNILTKLGVNRSLEVFQVLYVLATEDSKPLTPDVLTSDSSMP